MTTLAGKVALVTGGGRGVGRGVVLALAEAGADVAIADVDTLAAGAQQYGDSHVSGLACAQRTAAEVGERGRRAVALAADVTSKVACAAMVADTVHALGGLDVLVCNAGVVSLVPVAHEEDRKSTRLNASHRTISYAVFCLKKKKKNKQQ